MAQTRRRRDPTRRRPVLHGDRADGEQASWVDGELYGRFDGFGWRTSDKLKINSFWLNYYTTEQAAINNNDPDPRSRVMQVWIDDIVLATEYIGPIRGKPTGGKKKATPSKSALLTPGLLEPLGDDLPDNVWEEVVPPIVERLWRAM